MCLADNDWPNSLAVQQDGASMKRRISPLQAMVMAGICSAFSAAFTSAAQETQPAPSEEADPEAVPDLEDAPDTVAAAVALLTLVSAIDEEATVTPTGATFDVDGTQVEKNMISLGIPRRAWEFTSLSNERDRPSLAIPKAQASGLEVAGNETVGCGRKECQDQGQERRVHGASCGVGTESG